MTISRTETEPLDEHVQSSDEHQSANQILRGVQRLLRAMNYESLPEVTLRSGRRADVVAIGPAGEIWIVEIKSSIADFRSDHKWPEYRDYCDAFYFATAPNFPQAILPEDCGLILADNYGGEIMRTAQSRPLPAARRKSITLAFARMAAARLLSVQDPAANVSKKS